MKEEQRSCQHIMVSPLDGRNTSSYSPTSSRRSHVFSELTTDLVVCLAESHTLPSAFGRITYHPRAAAPPPGCRVSTRSSPSQQGTFPTGHFIPA